MIDLPAQCAICGREVFGDDHVKIEVERVPPEQPEKTYYFHPHCFENSQNWERYL